MFQMILFASLQGTSMLLNITLRGAVLQASTYAHYSGETKTWSASPASAAGGEHPGVGVVTSWCF